MIDQYVRDKIQLHIKHLIDTFQGMKSQELLNRIMAEYIMLEKDDLKKIIIDMVQAGDILEVEYHIFGSVSRSFFLPPNTRIEIIKYNAS